MSESLIDYLIRTGEAVEYGERWTEKTTYEWWWVDEAHTLRDCRLVMTNHGGGNRGDDDEAEYVRRLLDMGRAVRDDDDRVHAIMNDPDAFPEITHVITHGKANRIRYYVGPPGGDE